MKLVKLLIVLTLLFNLASVYSNEVPASDSNIAYMGRARVSGNQVVLAYPGIELKVRFTGSAIGVRGRVINGSSHFNVSVDGIDYGRLDLDEGDFSMNLAEGLDSRKTHMLRLVRRNEAWQGIVRLDAFSIDESAKWLNPIETRGLKMLSIGDSITCGNEANFFAFSNKGNHCSNGEDSYAWYIAKSLNAQIHLVSYGGKGLVRDWQGFTSVVKAPEFFERSLPDDPHATWDHQLYTPDLVTIALGTNDFSKGVVEEDVFVPAYIEFVKRIHEVYPKARILLINSPWFAEGSDKYEALKSYMDQVVESFSSEGDFIKTYHFKKLYTGTSRDAHPIKHQQIEMAEELTPLLREWLL